MKKLSKTYLDLLTYQIIGAAIRVHKELGPGLLEKVYERCLIYELKKHNIKVIQQESIPFNYKDIKLNLDLRYDLLIEDCIVIELKAISKILPIHKAQTMSYARLLKVPKSILLNFTCTNIMKEGQKTFVNEYFYQLPDN